MNNENLNNKKIGCATSCCATSWLRVGAMVLFMTIAVTVCFIAIPLLSTIPLRSVSPGIIKNEVAMNPILTKMVYNEHTEKLIITGKNKRSEFKLDKEDWEHLELALTKRERKDWTGWTFEEEEVVIGGKDYAEAYIIYTGTREPRQKY